MATFHPQTTKPLWETTKTLPSLNIFLRTGGSTPVQFFICDFVKGWKENFLLENWRKDRVRKYSPPCELLPSLFGPLGSNAASLPWQHWICARRGVKHVVDKSSVYLERCLHSIRMLEMRGAIKDQHFGLQWMCIVGRCDCTSHISTWLCIIIAVIYFDLLHKHCEKSKICKPNSVLSADNNNLALILLPCSVHSLY